MVFAVAIQETLPLSANVAERPTEIRWEQMGKGARLGFTGSPWALPRNKAPMATPYGGVSGPILSTARSERSVSRHGHI